MCARRTATVLVDEPVFVLSIGSVVGGSTAANRVWRDALAELARGVASARHGVTSPLNLNVVFQVPGDILRPDFEGVRTGRFSTRDRLLMIQAALPETVAPDPDRFVREALVAAVGEGERWARRRGIASDLKSLRDLALAV